MIKNIIYVEDGSVDVDELQESLGEDTKIILYRQGAVKPVVEQLAVPINTAFNDYEQKFYKKLETVRELFNEIYKCKKSQKLHQKLQQIYDTLYEGIDF